MARFEGTTDELELLLLERRLEEYARRETENFDEPLNADDLFNGSLTDLGYDKLARTMDLFPDKVICEVASRVFVKFPVAKSQ
jgi:hypothetical protein